MTTTRVDHFWDDPPPNFVQRVGIYAAGTPKRVGSSTDGLLTDEEVDLPKTRKERCEACSPERYLRNAVVFDERRPYTPPKQKISNRSDTPVDWHSQYKSRCDEDKIEFRGKKWAIPPQLKSTTPKPAVKIQKRRKKNAKSQPSATPIASATDSPLQDPDDDSSNNPGSLILSQGELSVAVKFPPRTGVIYRNSTNDSQRVLRQDICECASFPRSKKANK